MKKKLIYIITILLFAIGACVLYIHIYDVFQPKYEIGKNNQALIEPDMNYDVFFLGTSHTGDIQPMLLWEEEGITSYNLFCRGGGLNRVYATLEMALEYKIPRVVVIDIDQWYDEQDFEDGPGDFHQTFDIFPLNKTKAAAVLDITEEKSERIELLDSFYRYHDRYDELTKDDFIITDDIALGAHLRFDSNAFTRPEIIDDIDLSSISEEDLADMEKLTRIIDLCQTKGIAVMLTHFASPSVSPSKQERMQQIELLADKYGIELVDFMRLDGLMNYNCDFRDLGHMNISGARKAGLVVAQVLKDKYGIADHRTDESEALIWNKKLNQFYAALDALTEAPAPTAMTITEAIVLMNLPHYSGEVYIKNSSTGYLSKPGVVDLLEQAAGCELEKIREAKSDSLDYLLIISKSGGTAVEFVGDEVTDIMGDPLDMEDALVALRDSETMDVVSEVRQYAAKQ